MKLSRVCFCSFSMFVGMLWWVRYFGLVRMCRWLVFSGCVCRVELLSVLMWIVMLVCCFNRLMIRLLVLSLSWMFGYSWWNLLMCGIIVCSMKGEVVLICRCLVGFCWCRVRCFLSVFICCRICCVWLRK